MKNVLIAGLLGGIAIFLWGSISWVVLPWHNMTMSSLPDEDAVVQELKDQQLETGAYYFPAMPGEHSGNQSTNMTEEQWASKHRQGPLGLLFYHRGGTDPMAASTMIFGLIFGIIEALIAAYLLSLSVSRLQSYGSRVIFVALLGLFGVLVSHITMWVWFYLPGDWTIVNSLDLQISWILAGLVIAWRIKPETSPAS